MKKIFILLLLVYSITLGAEKKVEVKEVQVSAELIEEKQEFVKVSTVPQDAAEVLVELKSIEEIVLPDEKNKNMLTEIEPYCSSIPLLLETPEYRNIEDHNVRDLQKMQSELSVYIKQLDGWEKILEAKIKLYDEKRIVLTDSSVKWSETHVNATKEDAPEAIQEHITSVIIRITEVDNKVKTKYDEILTLSQIVITNTLALKEKITMLKERELLVAKKIFFQNEKSLFKALLENSFSMSIYVSNIRTTLLEKYNEIYAYFDTHSEHYLIFITLYLAGVIPIVYANYLYRKKKLFIYEESYLKKKYFYIKNVFSVMLIYLVLMIKAVFEDTPKAFFELQLIILIIPILRIVQGLMNKQAYKYISIFAILLFILLLNKNASGEELEGRILMLFVNVFLFSYFVKLVRQNLIENIEAKIVRKVAFYSIIASLFFLPVALFSNLYGAVLLSSKIIELVFFIIFATVIFYVLHTILIGYLVIVIRRRIATASYMLERYSQDIEGTTKLLVKIWMLSWWALVVIKLLGIYPYLASLVDTVLALSWEIGLTTISLQAIFDFILIVIATWIAAKLIRALLEVEVFSRFKFPRGAPTAIITVLNYIIVISGTIISLSSLGVTSQQFAIVFGALGVGIGFGLRNIIANFISGIIMVFERPVQLGDVIEIDNTMGSIQSIGARASTVKTFDGSEVIIPNADFIGKEIVNWTLSDQDRRKTIEFKVNLDNDIDDVLDISKRVVVLHPDVLKDPEPIATLTGFGEYSLNFKIYYWLSDNLIVAQSDVAIGIYNELQKEGITMPVPKTHLQGEGIAMPVPKTELEGDK